MMEFVSCSEVSRPKGLHDIIFVVSVSGRGALASGRVAPALDRLPDVSRRRAF